MDTFSFFERGDFKVSYQTFLRVVRLLGRKLFFSTPLGQQKFSEVSNFLCVLMLSF